MTTGMRSCKYNYSGKVDNSSARLYGEKPVKQFFIKSTFRIYILIMVVIINKRIDFSINLGNQGIKIKTLAFYSSLKSNGADSLIIEKLSQAKISCCDITRIKWLLTQGQFHIQIARYRSQVCVNGSKCYKVTDKSCKAAGEIDILQSRQVWLSNFPDFGNECNGIGISCPEFICLKVDKCFLNIRQA